MGSILRWFKWACKFFGEQSALAVSKTKIEAATIL